MAQSVSPLATSPMAGTQLVRSGPTGISDSTQVRMPSVQHAGDARDQEPNARQDTLDQRRVDYAVDHAVEVWAAIDCKPGDWLPPPRALSFSGQAAPCQ